MYISLKKFILEENERTIKLLQTYGNAKKMKKETLRILLNQLDDTKMIELKNKFKDIDQNNHGVISMD